MEKRIRRENISPHASRFFFRSVCSNGGEQNGRQQYCRIRCIEWDGD